MSRPAPRDDHDDKLPGLIEWAGDHVVKGLSRGLAALWQLIWPAKKPPRPRRRKRRQ